MKTRILVYSIVCLLIAGVVALKFYSPLKNSEYLARVTGQEIAPPISSGEGSPILYAVLDLNGDGVGSVSIKDPIVYFDHTGNGVRVATTWILPQDGFVGMDLNQNGILDNGTELIGNHFKTGTDKAENSFKALAFLDANRDGLIDNKDATYSKLVVWQDTNKDAICQTTEIQTLGKLGISSIKTNLVVQRALGTQVTGSGDFQIQNAATGTSSSKEFIDLNFEVNTFYRVFAKRIPITEEAKELPSMGGSGLVRDMDEAASLSPTFSTKLAAYAKTPTRDGQLKLLNDLIAEWGKTSGLADMQTRATQNGYTLTAELDPKTLAMLTTMEQFNGRGFFAMPWEEHIGNSARQGLIVGWDGNPKHIKVKMYPTQLQPISSGYQTLKDSVYKALLTQSRLKPYRQAIRFSIFNGSISYNYDLIQEAFKNNFERAPEETIIDLVEFNIVTKNDQEMQYWDSLGVGSTLLNRFLMEITPSPALQSFLAENSITPPPSTGLASARSKAIDLPESQPEQPSRKQARPLNKSLDLRHCLKMNGNYEIIQCTEQMAAP